MPVGVPLADPGVITAGRGVCDRDGRRRSERRDSGQQEAAPEGAADFERDVRRPVQGCTFRPGRTARASDTALLRAEVPGQRDRWYKTSRISSAHDDSWSRPVALLLFGSAVTTGAPRGPRRRPKPRHGPARAVVSKSEAALDREFAQVVRPFVDDYCAECHSGARPEAQFDLTSFTNLASVLEDFPHWALVMERLEHQEMPPKPEPPPPAALRQRVIDWVKAVRANELRKNPGDPGPVLARRLSNSEYNYTIRDLIGVDLEPTREFPVDPANQAGFDNTGETLTMSPALFNKYLLASRDIADHMALTPDGFIFAPGPVLAETARDQFAVKRIVDFYQAQPTDYADYFEAAWRYKHRAALGSPTATLASTARASEGLAEVSACGLADARRVARSVQAAAPRGGAHRQAADHVEGSAGAGIPPDRRPGRRSPAGAVCGDARLRRPHSHEHRHAVHRARGERSPAGPGCSGARRWARRTSHPAAALPDSPLRRSRC